MNRVGPGISETVRDIFDETILHCQRVRKLKNEIFQNGANKMVIAMDRNLFGLFVQLRIQQQGMQQRSQDLVSCILLRHDITNIG